MQLLLVMESIFIVIEWVILINELTILFIYELPLLKENMKSISINEKR